MNIKNVIPQLFKVNVPEVATKMLKLRKANDKKIMTLSSNWLPLFGFHGDAQVVEEVIAAGKGFRVRLANEADVKTKKVYVREYKSRSANPLKKDAKRVEQLIETAGQKLINEAMGDTEYAHITFSYGVITFAPITIGERKLLQNMNEDDMINTLVAMTGGVDCSVLENAGFRIDTVIEYRPQEKRDGADYTETTALSALTNSKVRVLCNEDIYTLDAQRLASAVGNTPISVAHMSLQCDDFSPLKTNKLKANSVEDLSSTLDMFIPALKVIDVLNVPVIVIENVPGFMNSPINDVFVLQLRRRGFDVHQEVFDAREYGGYTSRKRMYLVATALGEDFSFPAPFASPEKHVWQDIIVPHLAEIMQHDITDLKVMKDAITSGRLRTIHKNKAHGPTLTKSQGSDTKDAVVVEHEGRYYRLPVQVQAELNALPAYFDAAWLPKDKAAQLIGQSIDCNLHHAIMISVKDHIKAASNALFKSLSPMQPTQMAFAV